MSIGRFIFLPILIVGCTIKNTDQASTRTGRAAPHSPFVIKESKEFSQAFNAELGISSSDGIDVDYIRYTLNGETPTCKSGILIEKFPVTIAIPAQTTTLQALSCSATGIAGSLLVRTYTFVAPPDTPKKDVTYTVETSTSSSTTSGTSTSSGNRVPTFNFVAPTSATVVAKDGVVDIQYSFSDSDDAATVSLYYSTANTGCTASLSGWQAIATDLAEHATGTHSWAVTSVATGTYFICAKADDGTNLSQYTLASGTIKINAPPTISITAPSGTSTMLSIGSLASITWTDSDSDDDAVISLFYKSSNTGNCNAGTQIDTISEDDSADTYNWNTAGLEDGFYYVCASINDAVNPPVEVYSGRVVLYPNSTCTWVGDTSTSWTTASNWAGCTGVPDTNVENVVVLAQALYQPTLSASKTIANFGTGKGGGSLTIASGATLTLAGPDIASSINFYASTSSCTTCVINATVAPTVKNNATLGMGLGTKLLLTNGVSLKVGSPSDTGHFKTLQQSETQSQWPIVTVGYAPGDGVLKVEGIANNQSSVDINGLQLLSYAQGLKVASHSRVIRLDSLYLSANAYVNTSAVIFSDCTGVTFNDTTFDKINFVRPQLSAVGTYGAANAGSGVYVATNCTTPLSITNASGLGWGEAFEYDPNSILTWPAATGYSCVWNSTTSDNSWALAANWTGCNNRSGVPDQFDTIDIPFGTVVNPLLPAGVYTVRGISGTGGGTLEFATNAYLTVAEHSNSPGIGTSITFKPASGQCSGYTCGFYSASNRVINNAVLTLLPGMTISEIRYSGTFQVGTTTSPGHLVINGGSDPARYPKLVSSTLQTRAFNIQGTPSQNSTLSIEGVIAQGGTYGISIGSNVSILKFDNARVPSMWAYAVTITNCTGVVMTDTSWDNIEFPGVSPSNAPKLVATHASCAALTPFSIKYVGLVDTPVRENDSYDKISWTQTCGGTLIDGLCMYLGNLGESCNQVCSANGGSQFNDYFTLGSAGTLAACQSTLQTLQSSSVTAANLSLADGIGCSIDSSGNYKRVNSVATSYAAANATYRRVCACIQ